MLPRGAEPHPLIAETGAHAVLDDLTESGVPPQLIPDLVDSTVFQPVIDPALCPQLAANAGTYAGDLVVIQSDGDVRTCWCMDPIGNIKTGSIRKIWESRPHWWESGCCLESRMSDAEKATVGLMIPS